MTRLLMDTLESELGNIVLIVDGETLCLVDFAENQDRINQLLSQRYGSVELLEVSNPLGFSDRLRDYLHGNLTSLEQIPVWTGGTPFQQQVWSLLRTIPPGTVMTYGQLAAGVGNPNACRAVGMANSLNPVAIVLPCHRVIGSNGKLSGYAGGLARKRWLLAHEGVHLT